MSDCSTITASKRTGPRPILLLLRVPPPYGGGEIRAASLAQRVSGNPRYVVSAMRNPGGTKANQGKLVLRNVVFAVRRIIGGWWLMLSRRPAALFVAIPKNFVAFLWVAVVTLPASWAGIHVCGDLAGMRFEFFNRWWKRAFALVILRRFHSIRFLGHGIREAHAPYRLPNLVVFSNGVEAPPSRPRTEAFACEKTLRLLYVGALEESKGVGLIIEAAALALAQGLPLRWTLVGEWAGDDFRARAEGRLREARLGDTVELTGRVTGDARWDYYRRAHIYVHPTRLDGQPLTILEAMSQGLVIISTPVGAIPETVTSGRNGRLIDPVTPANLLEAVKAFLSDRAMLLSVMRVNREDFLARFTIERYVSRQMEWLEAAADDRVAFYMSDPQPSETAAPSDGGGPC